MGKDTKIRVLTHHYMSVTAMAHAHLTPRVNYMQRTLRSLNEILISRIMALPIMIHVTFWYLCLHSTGSATHQPGTNTDTEELYWLHTSYGDTLVNAQK